MNIKILSWNIWIDSYFDEVKNFLNNNDADIIGLQEVLENDSERNIISFLEGLGYHHVFAPIEKAWNGKNWSDGPAIFTKHEIIDSQKYILSKNDKRAAVRADIKIDNKIIHAFSTHLIHTHQQESELQFEQVKNLIKELPNENTIVMGDFNATPESTGIKEMKKILNDSDPLSQPTWSLYENGCFKCKIKELKYKLDYIFTSIDITVKSFKVEQSKGSDHLPISTVIEI